MEEKNGWIEERWEGRNGKSDLGSAFLFLLEIKGSRKRKGGEEVLNFELMGRLEEWVEGEIKKEGERKEVLKMEGGEESKRKDRKGYDGCGVLRNHLLI